ncbi:MAG: ABC transporter permease [Oscillospiraceae bacterium]|nr:ABC transporter permease [Oscillospiraceae bacterium]
MTDNDKSGSVIKKITGAKEFTLVVIWAVLVLVLWLLNRNFLSPGNIRSIFNSAFVIGILAVGLSCLLIGGKIDLSSGNTGMLAGVLISILLRDGVHWVPAILITLAFGAVTGAVNAFFVNGLKFAPFISTLAVSSIYGGVALVITNSANIPVSSQDHDWFLALGTKSFGVLPVPFLIALVLLAVYGGVLWGTGFGRRVYMTGGNANAARLAGINPVKITSILFVNNSVIASVAGILFAAFMKMGSPIAISGSDLDGITAAILGGVAFTGGSGNMFGVFIGLMMLTSFQNGLLMAGLDSYYQVVAKGLLLIGALILDYYRENARLRALKAGK